MASLVREVKEGAAIGELLEAEEQQPAAQGGDAEADDVAANGKQDLMLYLKHLKNIDVPAEDVAAGGGGGGVDGNEEEASSLQTKLNLLTATIMSTGMHEKERTFTVTHYVSVGAHIHELLKDLQEVDRIELEAKASVKFKDATKGKNKKNLVLQRTLKWPYLISAKDMAKLGGINSEATTASYGGRLMTRSLFFYFFWSRLPSAITSAIEGRIDLGFKPNPEKDQKFYEFAQAEKNHNHLVHILNEDRKQLYEAWRDQCEGDKRQALVSALRDLHAENSESEENGNTDDDDDDDDDKTEEEAAEHDHDDDDDDEKEDEEADVREEHDHDDGDDDEHDHDDDDDDEHDHDDDDDDETEEEAVEHDHDDGDDDEKEEEAVEHDHDDDDDDDKENEADVNNDDGDDVKSIVDINYLANAKKRPGSTIIDDINIKKSRLNDSVPEAYANNHCHQNNDSVGGILKPNNTSQCKDVPDPYECEKSVENLKKLLGETGTRKFQLKKPDQFIQVRRPCDLYKKYATLAKISLAYAKLSDEKKKHWKSWKVMEKKYWEESNNAKNCKQK
jgi:hypothetical protein